MNYLGIQSKNLKPVVDGLNLLLSNYQVYYQNLRAFHWNVEGQNFFELHRVFEELYNDAKIRIDDIAERILTLRHRPLSSMSAYLEKSKIDEAKSQMEDDQMVKTILENHRELILIMRGVLHEAGEVNDEGTIDLIAGFLGEIEKKSWMLDAWKSKVLSPQH